MIDYKLRTQRAQADLRAKLEIVTEKIDNPELEQQAMVHPKCFISYSWDDELHKDWIRHLATDLQNNGVITFLDQWDVLLGMDLTRYMESCIRESDFVLLVCTPIFARKANAGEGGSGYEKSIVTGEIFEGAPATKFVPLLRKGTEKESLPSYLKSRAYVDFRSDESYAQNLESLLRHLYQSPKHVRPPLGAEPPLKSVENSQPAGAHQPLRGFQFAKFKELYDFAYSSNGLDLSKQEAEKWATNWLEVLAESNFNAFKELFQYAYSSSGLDLNKEQANEWAKDWLQRFSDRDIEAYKKVRDFAYSSSGLDLEKEQADEWTKNWLHRCRFEDFGEFEELYRFAYSSSGLDLGKTGAAAWAIDKLSKK